MKDYAETALKYAKWAAKGGDHVCKWTRLAAKRHISDRKRTDWGYEFVDWHVADICQFVEALPHVEGTWDTSNITLEPWQVFLLGMVFGWRRRSDGGRRFNTAYIELARKNGKSCLSSAVALYCLTCEGEVGPQVKIGATTGDQARIVFDVARKMVDMEPDLREAFSIEAMANAIPCWSNGGSMKPINAKASTQDGLNPHCTVIDELHAHKERDLFDVLKSARGARKNPLSWYITTAGYNVQGVCYEQRTLVTKILEGIIEAEHFFGIIYTLDEGDDEFDERVWGKANPNLGVSVQLPEFRGYAEEAKASPDSHAEYLTKRLNVWTSAKHGWINVVAWKKCGGAVDLDALKELPCFMGIDLGATSDLTSVWLVWKAGDRLKVWGKNYVPENAVEPRTRRGNVPYQRWVKDGFLTATDGDVTDYAYVEKDIHEMLDTFDVQEIGYDKWNSSDLTNRLVAEGAPMVEFRQGPASFNPPMKALERYYLDGKLDHGGNPLLGWAASNIVARHDVNKNLAPDKKNSMEKIDPVVAILQGLGLALNYEDPASVYEDREMIVL